MIALFAVTDAGRRAAAEVAPALDAQVHPLDELQRLWPRLDAAVFFLATGATVRLVAPLLADKQTDPGVVCVDEARRFAVAVTGGHEGGANALAERVGALLGAQPVITTASDATATTGIQDMAAALDAVVDGDAAAAGRALLDGAAVVENPLAFPLPPTPVPRHPAVRPGHRIVVTDRLEADVTRVVPRTLVLGIGSARGVAAAAVADTVRRIETEHGFDLRAVRAYASVDLKADEAGILAAIAPAELRTYPAQVLAGVAVPNPSEVVRAEVGTPSVAEAAALHAAAELGGGAPVELVVEKVKGENVTVAAARIRPRGRLAIIGLGPGAADLRVPRAEAELRRASVVVGLDQYVEQVRHLLRPGTEVRVSGLGDEEQRAADAVALATKGRAVALIGSGDAGVYAMASPALQQAGADIEVVGVPGVTASLAAAALLGAPLGHDHVLISLSDLHTPWPVIEKRIAAAAEADLVTCFYNPRSRDRHWQLGAALDAFRAYRPPSTPVGAVRQASRAGQRVWAAPLAEFDPTEVDMLTTVVVGSSATRMVAGRMVTPRGYRWS
ncbi:cobalt-precorrin 5A hydrolase/precorrin-3B C17-methyltransferase [Pseudonocardia hierapolitana]|uniref:Cobalt-precorrin 5A hydrolase/precorrin-3B C17-methyltransferase n=1 Tax=Pseudonocardia hierapolitana TaxID=1128676 RepID=A0A561SHA7_9PSEU|nr:precorrin-3B C(17)-methyltransferase [Pseudonocardia hierapolitana]TWF74249.1 cobalt-precorrin 5A hydrolase/precorrin-3B C17-methyltransferase [Pseudonocardia hierapolitana]